MRLIDGDALKRKLQKVATEAWKMKLNASIEKTFNQCMDYIDSAPTIKPKQGEWICELINPLNAILRCSACGYATGTKYNFCPNCGARMKGADDENA